MGKILQAGPGQQVQNQQRQSQLEHIDAKNRASVFGQYIATAQKNARANNQKYGHDGKQRLKHNKPFPFGCVFHSPAYPAGDGETMARLVHLVQ